MKIILKLNDYTQKEYSLVCSKTVLDFMGMQREDSFSVPYSEIDDFYVTEDSKGRMCFTTKIQNEMIEGNIVDSSEVKEFTAAIKKKIKGYINIEVRRY